MARMIPLVPAPQVDIGAGPYYLVAVDAGRYSHGLRFTCQPGKHDEQLLVKALLVEATNITPAVDGLAQALTLPQGDVELALLALIDTIERWLRHRHAPPVAPAPDARPEIELTTEITAVANRAEAALLQPALTPLYQHSQRLVSIAAAVKTPKGLKRPDGLPIIAPATVSRLTELAARAARFYTETADGRAYHRPPGWLMQTLLERPERPFALLEAIVHAPTLRPDGSLLTEDGYDQDTGLYLVSGGVEYPPIPLAPTRDEARAALARLALPLCDFPFAEPYHKSAAVAMILTLICRHFIASSIPVGSITAHGQGAGKGLLAHVIALTGTGRPCTFWPQPSSEDEERKRLLAIGLEGDPVVCIDNIMRPFGSGTFANVLTSMSYGDRILGVSRNAQVRFHCVWLATGNNITYVGELVRRVVPIVIDPKMEHPEKRDTFVYPNLLGHVLAERPQLVSSALTIMLAFIRAGCPRQTTDSYGSFDDWYQKICGALLWLGEPDPCAGREGLQAEVEEELLQVKQLVLAWHACYQATLGTPRTLKQVAFDIPQHASQPPDAPNAWNDLRDALSTFDPKYDGQRLDTAPAGYALRKHQKRVIAGMRFVAQPRSAKGTPWVLEPVEPV